MSQTISAVFGHLHHGRSDVSLLADFIERHDALAFGHLVERHAGLVWSVCKRIVRRHQSAEDAFQATFVVLMQKAPRLQLHSQLSTWLYGVAVRIARRTQARDARLYCKQEPVIEASASEQHNDLTVRELMAIVQEEVQKLPRRYQPVLELCLFNQMPVREAAEQLQVSSGIVRGCLERGRKQLQSRLLRRGITPLALGAMSLTALNAHPVSIELVAVVQGMVSHEVPARLLALTVMSLSSLKPVFANMALVLLLITTVTLGMVKLLASTQPQLPVPVNSVMNPEKPADAIQGFVDDHLGNPVPHVKVEVYRDRKLEQEIQTDGVGRFEIPNTWNQEHNVLRKLIVRQGREALGWKTVASHDASTSELHITMLPLQAEVKGTMCNEQGGTVSSVDRVSPFFGHRNNGWMSSKELPEGVILLPIVTDAQGQFSVKFPIQTQGFIIASCKECLNRRLRYVSVGAGQCDLGKVHLSRPGLIQGTVTDEEGIPLAGVSILAQHNWKDKPQGVFLLDGISSEAISDTKGHYVLDGLESGAKFNVMLKESYTVPGKEVPLVFKAIEGVSLSKEKPTEINLKLVPGIKLLGKIVDAKTEEPLKDVSLAYHGSGRPESSGGIMTTQSDKAGAFHFWVPSGYAHVSCNDGKNQGSYSLNIDQNVQPRLAFIKAEKREPSERIVGKGMSSHEDVLKPGPKQAVIAEGDTKVSEISKTYMHNIEFQTEKKLPTKFFWRIYQMGKVPASTSDMYHTSFTRILNGNVAVVQVPLLEDENCTLEIDVEGFVPQILPVKAEDNLEVLAIKLTPARYLPIQVQVSDSQGKQTAQARVQVELKRQGTVVDAPWGPVLITDERGNARIDHLRIGDTFCLRAWGQDGSTAVTDWKTMTPESEKVVTIKLGQPVLPK